MLTPALLEKIKPVDIVVGISAKNVGIITNNLAYPLTRALYGFSPLTSVLIFFEV